MFRPHANANQPRWYSLQHRKPFEESQQQIVDRK
jgi:hypothetical protein